MGQIISFQNLSIAPYEVEKLLDVKMEHKMNEHSTLYVKALLSEDVKDNYVKKCRQGSDVSLYIKNSENAGVLFCGIVKNVARSFSCLDLILKKMYNKRYSIYCKGHYIWKESILGLLSPKRARKPSAEAIRGSTPTR